MEDLLSHTYRALRLVQGWIALEELYLKKPVSERNVYAIEFCFCLLQCQSKALFTVK